MRTFTRQLPFSIYLLIFILLQFVLVVLLSYGKQQVSDSYQQQFSLELENDFAFTLSHYRDLSNFSFGLRSISHQFYHLWSRLVVLPMLKSLFEAEPLYGN